MIMPGTLSERSQKDLYIEIVVPVVMGIILNWTLYGVLITQFCIYTYNFPNDGRPFKYLAYGMVFLETLQSGFALADLFYLIGTPNIVIGYITGSTPSGSLWVWPILIGSVVAVIVQLFFVYRIWVLSNNKSWWLCLTILFFSITSLISEIIGSVIFLLPHWNEYKVQIVIVWVCAMIWLTGSAVTDGIITISMLYLLKSECNEGTSLLTKNAISKIVRLTVETNLLTTAIAILSLVTFIVAFRYGNSPGTNWAYFPTAIIGKLYANSLFASLNNRIAIRQGPRPNALAAITIPDATLSRDKPSNNTSDGMYFQRDRPTSAMILTTSRESTRGSRESGGGESLVIDIA